MIELASNLLPSLTPPPGYNRSDVGMVLTSREEERLMLEEDELREAKAKEKAKILAEKMVSFASVIDFIRHASRPLHAKPGLHHIT